jgi:phage terminase small subunit
MAKSKKMQIKQDLLDQLERNGVFGQHYIDLANDYMALWEVKNKLIKDIKEKGVQIKYQNGENQWGYKKNDSVRELTNVNNQMLRLLDSLGLKPSKFEAEEDDDWEM